MRMYLLFSPKPYLAETSLRSLKIEKKTLPWASIAVLETDYSTECEKVKKCQFFLRALAGARLIILYFLSLNAKFQPRGQKWDLAFRGPGSAQCKKTHILKNFIILSIRTASNRLDRLRLSVWWTCVARGAAPRPRPRAGRRRRRRRTHGARAPADRARARPGGRCLKFFSRARRQAVRCVIFLSAHAPPGVSSFLCDLKRVYARVFVSIFARRCVCLRVYRFEFLLYASGNARLFRNFWK